jgi:hypothetical protein
VSFPHSYKSKTSRVGNPPMRVNDPGSFVIDVSLQSFNWSNMGRVSKAGMLSTLSQFTSVRFLSCKNDVIHDGKARILGPSSTISSPSSSTIDCIRVGNDDNFPISSDLVFNFVVVE